MRLFFFDPLDLDPRLRLCLRRGKNEPELLILFRLVGSCG